jgi:hypothetical protein
MSLKAVQNTKVFISYVQEDIEYAQRLYQQLKSYGLQPWLDKEELLPGQNWKITIKNAIETSRYFIALFSPNSVEARGFVQKQLKEALNILDEFPSKDIFIIPVRLGDCKVSDERINDLHMVDLSRDWDNGIEKILKAMNIDGGFLRNHDRSHFPPKDDYPTINLAGVYWNNLLTPQRCIPFIGPNASCFVKEDGEPWIPSDIQIAKDWTKEHDYPFGGSDLCKKCNQEHGFPLDGSYQLARVAQFLAIKNRDEMFPKFLLSEYLSKIDSPDFSSQEYKNTTFVALAELNLKIYITTNYDLLMEKALVSKGKHPVTEFCRWNNDLSKLPPCGPPRYKPDKDKPLVFHLHGEVNTPRSMVLTEKDYFDFIINSNKGDEKELLPNIVRQELPMSSLLFIGYALEDIKFRTIFQGALSFLGTKSGKISVAVQIPPIIENGEKERIVLNYLNLYTKNMFEVYAYWGNITNFVTEFRERWQKFVGDKKN